MLSIKEFYDKMPFNQHKSVRKEVKTLLADDPVNFVPILQKLPLTDKSFVLEAGSGTGWLLNGLNYYHNVEGFGIDLNKRAVEFANKVSNKLGLSSMFYNTDIFEFKTSIKFDAIISYGVLHHTRSCHMAIRHLSAFLKEDGYLVLGLYHTSRRPFLNHFNELKEKLSLRQLKREFFKFKYGSYSADKTVLESIFYDQVFNPYETQHSFVEIKNLLESLGYSIISTSVNDYKPISGKENWTKLDKQLTTKAEQDLANKVMNFGFFTVLAKKNS
jgi:SAM-dependent methyltransferase